MSRVSGRWRLGFGGVDRVREAIRLRKLVRQAGAVADEDVRAKAPLYEECLALFRNQENWNGVLWARSGLANVAMQRQDYSAARSHFEQCVSLSRRLQSTQSLAASLLGLGHVVTIQGEVELADKLSKESLEHWRKLEDAQGIASTYCLLGSVAANEDVARTHFDNALILYRERNHMRGIIAALIGLGYHAAPGRDNARERAALEESLELCRASNATQSLSYTLNNLGNIERYEGQLEQAAALYRESLTLKQELGDRWAISYSLEGCAALAITQGQGERAAQLLGAAASIRESLGAPLERAKRAEYDANMASARTLLDPDTFESAWRDGKAFSLSQAVAVASKPVADNA